MSKNNNLNPVMFGENILKRVEKHWLQEALNLSARAEISSFINDKIQLREDSGFLRYLISNKTTVKNIRTAIGTIRSSMPVVIDRRPKAPKKITFNSTVYPKGMSEKLAFNASLAWRFIEALAMADFTEVKTKLMDLFTNCDRKNLSHWLSRTFEARYELWDKRYLAEPRHPLIWIDKVQLRHQGPYKDFRLYVAAGITFNGLSNLLGVYRSANQDDYLSWKNLFEDLRNHGLTDLPPVTGTLDSHALKGIKDTYENFSPIRPNQEEFKIIFSRIPIEHQKMAQQISQAIDGTKNLTKIDHYLSIFVKHYVLNDPQMVIDLFNPYRYFLRLKLFKSPPEIFTDLPSNDPEGYYITRQ
jgi:hypothetical protein